MKNIIIALLLSVFAFAKAYTQNIEGIATYQTQRHVEMKLDSSSGMTDEMHKSIQEQLRKQFQRKYDLTFKGSQALWQQQPEELAKPQAPSSGGMVITVSASKDVLFQDIAAKKYTQQSDLMGKLFLIEDKLEKPEWKLEKETKNIGQYTCFKATLEEEQEERSTEIVDGESKTVTKTTTRKITAWYTLDIPLSHGPDEFWGLPGLILEVNDGKLSMMCTKVVLNPKEPIAIVVPVKGKKVDQATYDETARKKSEELMERMQSNRKKGDGSMMTISIKG
ncbi:MAG: GLPGLI family protein [Cytophagaceae bacterium]|nr:GLPGLI family protein [Cytophagaceae bacterium]|tara:strand:- start:357 stop:1193 length:837 start_codon:yes stop_codon:yes gene_type:complete